MDNESKESDLENHPVADALDPVVEEPPNLADTVESVTWKAEDQERAESIISELNEVTNRFKMHQPSPQQLGLMDDLAKTYAYLAKMILALCPRCADRTHALRQLQDSKMWANTAIMLEGKI